MIDPAQRDVGSAAKRRGAATARTAAGLTVLIGLWHVFGVVAVALDDSSDVWMIIGIGLNTVIGCLALAAAAVLFARRPAGWILCVLACAFAIGMYVFRALRTGGGLAEGSETTALAIVVVPALLAGVLALVPPTRRWLSASRSFGR